MSKDVKEVEDTVVEAIEEVEVVEEATTTDEVKEAIENATEVVEATKDTVIADEIAQGRAVSITDRDIKAGILWGLMNEGSIDPMILLSALNHIVEEIKVVNNGISIQYNEDVPLMQMNNGAGTEGSEQ